MHNQNLLAFSSSANNFPVVSKRISAITLPFEISRRQMTFHDLVSRRYSAREYTSQSVGDDTLYSILSTAFLAPSAKNAQPWYVVVIRDHDQRRRLYESVYSREWFLQAPLILCVCVDTQAAFIRSDGHNYAYVDAAILMDHIILAAAEKNLGTCWIGNFNAAAAREVLTLPLGIEPVAFTPLGFASGYKRPRKRKEPSEMIYQEKFGDK